MKRLKPKAGKENVEDNRPTKRLKQDNEKDLIGNSHEVDMSLNPGSLTTQGKSYVPVQSIDHPQTQLSNTEVFGDLTNLHNIGLNDRRTQRCPILAVRRTTTHSGSTEENPTSFTQLLRSMGSQGSFFVGSPNYMESQKGLIGAGLTPTMGNIPGTTMRNDLNCEISNGQLANQRVARTHRHNILIQKRNSSEAHNGSALLNRKSDIEAKETERREPKTRKYDKHVSVEDDDSFERPFYQEQVKRQPYVTPQYSQSFNEPSCSSFTSLLQSMLTQTTSMPGKPDLSQSTNGCPRLNNTQINVTGNSVLSSIDSDSEESCDGFWEEDTANADNVYQHNSDTETDDENEYHRVKDNREAYNVGNNLENYKQKSTKGDCSSTDSPTEEDYKDDGDIVHECPKCGALFWYNERRSKNWKTRTPIFSMCCLQGKIKLPILKEPPTLLHSLLTNDDVVSKHFRENIRPLNMMFSFTSLGGKIDNLVNQGKGPKVFKLHGENYHLIGSVKPKRDESAKFLQLYIHDTENEVQNRIAALSGNSDSSKIRADLVDSIMKMLRECNVHVQTFRNSMDRFNDEDECQELSLALIHGREKDGRVYILPTTSEVAALVVGDFTLNMDKRDIILEKNSGKLKRINELHPCYLPPQYPLIFPYGEDGFRLGIKNGFTGITKRKTPNISMREFFAYRIQIRKVGSQVLLLSRRLLQQFLVDAYTMIESHRLRYIRKNQSDLRTLSYSKFVSASNNGHSSLPIEGNRIIIPSSFTGGPRYMHQMYLDCMSICKYYGFPDLFITFTCNPKWPELTRYFQIYNLRSEYRPDLCCRLFKVKLDCLMDGLTKKHLLGKTVSAVYTIEFQKRGLPHAHILLFMDPTAKIPSAEDIDRIITAEIPDKNEEPRLYEVVRDTMIHGPCVMVNKDSPCMQDGHCTKFFPRKIVEKTTVDAQGYPIYRRREGGSTVEKRGIQLDNRFVVPYNKQLSLRYKAHINVEWCNQARSIKYLFKYIHKGQDCITATITQKTNKESDRAETNDNGGNPGVNVSNGGGDVGVNINGDARNQPLTKLKIILMPDTYLLASQLGGFVHFQLIFELPLLRNLHFI